MPRSRLKTFTSSELGELLRGELARNPFLSVGGSDTAGDGDAPESNGPTDPPPPPSDPRSGPT